jgi:SAM-dependent methyltransferase
VSGRDAGGGDETAARLDSGFAAEVVPDRFQDGSFELVVDGTPQSHVDLDDPTRLFFEYVRRMGHVIDQLPEGPVTALHLGAGALTIPRYIAATRPGSRQQVVELEPRLVELVRERLPLPKGASIRVRYGDARDVLGRLPAGLRGTIDVLVVDVFGGARIPAHVTSAEFYAECAEFLAPGGVLLVNVADGTGLAFARGQAATLRHVFDGADAGGGSRGAGARGAGSHGDHVAALADTALLKGRRFGNVVFAASHAALPLEWIPRLLAGGPHPAKVVHGRELVDWIAGAPIVSDATAVASPPPARSIFLTGRS